MSEFASDDVDAVSEESIDDKLEQPTSRPERCTNFFSTFFFFLKCFFKALPTDVDFEKRKRSFQRSRGESSKKMESVMKSLSLEGSKEKLRSMTELNDVASMLDKEQANNVYSVGFSMLGTRVSDLKKKFEEQPAVEQDLELPKDEERFELVKGIVSMLEQHQKQMKDFVSRYGQLLKRLEKAKGKKKAVMQVEAMNQTIQMMEHFIDGVIDEMRAFVAVYEKSQTDCNVGVIFQKLLGFVGQYASFGKHYGPCRKFFEHESSCADVCVPCNSSNEFWLLFDSPYLHIKSWLEVSELLLEVTPPEHPDHKTLKQAWARLSGVTETLRIIVLESDNMSRVDTLIKDTQGMPPDCQNAADFNGNSWVMEGLCQVSFQGAPEVKMRVVLLRRTIFFITTDSHYKAHYELRTVTLEKAKKSTSSLVVLVWDGDKRVVLNPVEHSASVWLDAITLLVGSAKDRKISSGTVKLQEKESHLPKFCDLPTLYAALFNKSCPVSSFSFAGEALLLLHDLLFDTTALMESVLSYVRKHPQDYQRVFQFLNFWITSSYCSQIQASEEAVRLLENFFMDDGHDRSLDSYDVYAVCHKSFLQFKKTDKKSEPNYNYLLDFTQYTKSFLPRSLPTNPKDMSYSIFENVEPKEIARQLALIDHAVYKCINVEELCRQNWNKNPERSPNVLRMIYDFNRLSMWWALQIVQCKDIKQRTYIMGHLIDIGYASKKIGNFNACMSIVACLATSPIRRLKRTFDALSSKHISRLATLRNDTSSALNFSNYRQMLRAQAPPCVPYLGIMLQDLVFLDESNPDWQDKDKGVLNFDKLQNMFKIMGQVLTFGAVVFPYRAIPELQSFLANAKCEADEAELFQLSLQSEPRAQ